MVRNESRKASGPISPLRPWFSAQIQECRCRARSARYFSSGWQAAALLLLSLRPAEADLPGGSDIDIAAREGQAISQKNYAVGLEMSCPGGAYHWAPEIPSVRTIAGPKPSKCELAHNRGSFFPKLGWLRSAPATPD